MFRLEQKIRTLRQLSHLVCVVYFVKYYLPPLNIEEVIRPLIYFCLTMFTCIFLPFYLSFFTWHLNFCTLTFLLLSHAGISCITCSYKAGSGMLYPLERGFIFVHKPPVHIRFDEISSVNFARVAGGGGSSRSFDFEVETKSGTTYVFSSIEK